MPSVLKRRGRIVSFRVSEDEYVNLCQATDAAGAHSISDFARHVTCHHSLILARTNGAENGAHHSKNGNGLLPSLSMAQTELHPGPAMALEVTRLRERMDELTHQVQTLTRRVSRGL